MFKITKKLFEEFQLNAEREGVKTDDVEPELFLAFQKMVKDNFRTYWIATAEDENKELTRIELQLKDFDL